MFNLEHETVQTRGKNHVVNHYTGVKEYCVTQLMLYTGEKLSTTIF